MTSRANFQSTRMNFKPQNEAFEGKGSKPIREAASVFEVLVLMIVHVCKKVLFYDTNLKIAIYLGTLFLLSLIADVLTFPKTYFSSSGNVFNLYFVKIGWFWTLFLCTPYVLLTSYTICCGNRRLIVTGHLTRLLVATISWYLWTTFFNVIETKYGRCNSRNYTDKVTCLKNGHFWNGFDISGHCFILIYSSLILIEESRAIIGWEKIKDDIRDENFYRSTNDRSASMNPLKNLTTEELKILRISYEKFTPYVRALLIAMTLLQLLWDVMLVSTILYYHIMVEKFVSGIIAILTWFVTYRVWYTLPFVMPNLPGQGVFKYNKEKTVAPQTLRKKSSSTNGKYFMGMPIHNKQDTPEAVKEDNR